MLASASELDFVVSACSGLRCLPAGVLQLGDTSACKMVYNTAQHLTLQISLLTAVVVVNILTKQMY